jgi:hypothetical protein
VRTGVNDVGKRAAPPARERSSAMPQLGAENVGLQELIASSEGV